MPPALKISPCARQTCGLFGKWSRVWNWKVERPEGGALGQGQISGGAVEVLHKPAQSSKPPGVFIVPEEHVHRNPQGITTNLGALHFHLAFGGVGDLGRGGAALARSGVPADHGVPKAKAPATEHLGALAALGLVHRAPANEGKGGGGGGGGGRRRRGMRTKLPVT